MQEFNFLDILITIMVVLGMWRGFTAGLIQSIVSLIGWLVALVAGTVFAEQCAPFFSNVVDSPVLQVSLGFLSVVLIIILIIQIIAYILKQILSTLRLSFLDKLAGGILGAAKSVLMILVFLSVATPLLANMPLWQKSVLIPELLPFAPVAQEFVKEVFNTTYQELVVDE